MVFEGLDGSGKSTQSQLLLKQLKKEGYRVAKIDFPQYGQKSAGLVEEYLNGKYGSAKEISPYQASIFYACDRYDASFKIKKWLKEGRVVVADRYVASNLGHQAGKIKNKKERERFIQWLYHLEYELFGIPKPDLTFLLKTSPELARKMAPKITDEEKKKKRKIYLGNKVRDIHEKDLKHLKKALESYLSAAELYPKEFYVVRCIKKGRLLAPELIHQEIWQVTRKMLNSKFKNQRSKIKR